MAGSSLCRIGIFYDGSYFTYAQYHYYHDRQLGWIDFRRLHQLIESYVSGKEQGFTHYKVVYAAWFQGLFKPTDPTEDQLRRDRRLDYDLMYAGIQPRYLPMNSAGREKGVDVSLAIDALQVATDGKIDIAVLITGDGDLVPLVRAIMKQGVRVMVTYFDYERDGRRYNPSEYLLNTCNYVLDFGQLETDKDYKTTFRTVFRRPDEEW